MHFKLVVSLILAGLAVLFDTQNVAVVELRFLFWKIAMSRALMFTLLVLLGIGTGWLIRGHMLHQAQGYLL